MTHCVGYLEDFKILFIVKLNEITEINYDKINTIKGKLRVK